jgi:putative ABC transport system ATP-binding protein
MKDGEFFMSDLIIKTEGLTKVFQMGTHKVHALRGVKLQIDQGEFVALMGPSGSGKSTLMHVLGCLDTPTSGKYFLEGREVSSLADNERAFIRSRRVGFVFQSFNLLPNLSALENVLLPLMYQGSLNGAERIAGEALRHVGLSDRLSHTPSELSGGEKQRVAIARAVVTDPAMILADEPTGNLDSGTGEEILDLLAGLHTNGRTILMVTHSDHASSFAERIVFIRDGQIVESETLHDTA